MTAMRPHFTLTAALALLLGSCAVMKEADAPVTMRLSPAFVATVPATLTGSIAVAPVQAGGFTSGRRYVYIVANDPAQIRQAATLFWEYPPPDVMARALIDGLRTRFQTVSGPEVSLRTDSRVTVTLRRFEEVSAGGDSRALVAFDASIVKSGALVHSASFCGTAPISNASTTNRAKAFEGAIEQAVSGLVQDMAEPGATPTRSC
jgi:ABC-type uncharacterized transport system auxiliary subunit